MKKAVIRIFYTVTGAAILAVSLIGFAALWGFTTWGDLDVDEIIFQLQAPLEGTGNGMILDYVVRGLFPVLLLLAAFLFVMAKLKTVRRRAFFCLGCLVCCLVAGIFVKNYIWKRLKMGEWLAGQKNESLFIQENYTDPEKVKLSFPEKKRNLLYIYLESMETTYADRDSGGSFDTNVIPELTELAKQNEDFSGSDTALNGGYVFSGTTNTTSAIFAHSTGLPLKVDIGNNNMDTQKSFFPNVVAIGDILEKEGYRQVFLLGSNATFGGRRLFFSDHGDFEIRDYKYAKKTGWIPDDYKVWWGFEDEKLFQFARDTLVELAAQDAPFNLTILTVDTHFEDGYVCSLCRDEFGDNQYANVMACSSRQVMDFIKWVQEQDFYQNTAVVLTGDHTTMDTDFCKEIDKGYGRRTYTAFINSAVQPADPGQKRSYSTMDTFPTTLAAMGVSIEGNRLALGTNLFSNRQTLTEEFGRDTEKSELERRSEFLHQLEKTEMDADLLIERIQKDMKESVTADSYDPETGFVHLEVLAPSFNMSVDHMEAEYQASGQKGSDRVRLDLKEGTKRTYESVLDISKWSGTGGKIRIHLYAVDGSVYKNVTSASLQELLEKAADE